MPHDVPHASRTFATVVLGSGRSGTSLCSRLLAILGVRMINTLTRESEGNPNGFFEDCLVVEANKRIIRRSSLHPAIPPVSERFKAAWLDERDALEAHFRQVAELGSPWGLKDPRIALFATDYAELIVNSGSTVRFILCVRNPVKVIDSLRRVDNTNQIAAEHLWHCRNVGALELCNMHDMFLLHYEDLLADPASVIHEVASFLDLSEIDGEVLQAATSLVNPDLNRSSGAGLKVSPLTHRLYAILRQAGTGRLADAGIGAEINEFVTTKAFYTGWIDLAGRGALSAGKIAQLRQDAAVATQPPGPRPLDKVPIGEVGENSRRNENQVKAFVPEIARMQQELLLSTSQRDAAIRKLVAKEKELEQANEALVHVRRAARLRRRGAAGTADQEIGPQGDQVGGTAPVLESTPTHAVGSPKQDAKAKGRSAAGQEMDGQGGPVLPARETARADPRSAHFSRRAWKRLRSALR